MEIKFIDYKFLIAMSGEMIFIQMAWHGMAKQGVKH